MQIVSEYLHDRMARGRYFEVFQTLREYEGYDLLLLKISLQQNTVGGIPLLLRELSAKNAEELVEHFRVHQCNRKYRHVLTDLDDTLFPTLGRFFFPGVGTVLHTLSETGYVTCLTARPARMVPRRKIQQIISCDALGGKFTETIRCAVKTTCLRWLRRYDSLAQYRPIVQTKYMNFRLYSRIFPEFVFVFIGDIVQGDFALATRLLKEPNVTGAYIRDVRGLWLKRKKKEGLQEGGVVIFSNFPELLVDQSSPC